jgi:hypothetical protein
MLGLIPFGSSKFQELGERGERVWGGSTPPGQVDIHTWPLHATFLHLNIMWRMVNLRTDLVV